MLDLRAYCGLGPVPLLKTFGVVLAPEMGGSFEELVLRGVPKDYYVEIVVGSLLSTWRHMSAELKKLNREIERGARAIPAIGGGPAQRMTQAAYEELCNKTLLRRCFCKPPLEIIVFFSCKGFELFLQPSHTLS
jgi:hypothetical protein